MQNLHETGLWALLETVVGTVRTVRLFTALEIHPDLLRPRRDRLRRAELAQALNMLLFEDVLRRVPMATAYVGDAVRAGRKLVFDHGALRTVATDCGALPAGELAFRRVLEPLGFECRGVYALDALGMTGRAYTHRDLPESIAQFFVSELHPERFSAAFQTVVQRVVGSSRDPLPLAAKAALAELEQHGELGFADATRLLPNLLGCFDRQHPEPHWVDYETLLRESKEMAWIATEGNAFNHATDRVADVTLVAEEQRRRGRPVKPEVEVSKSGRVRQTAFRAAMVERLFVGADGSLRSEVVPGSFHEFITRAEEAPGLLDLRFDSGNAAAIFKMTSQHEGRP
ncbi:MAG TPA: DUF1338 family protein [Planctomycetota bacterium]|nr:DUF1338 family protein [Planctomycetota bacterium]